MPSVRTRTRGLSNLPRTVVGLAIGLVLTVTTAGAPSWADGAGSPLPAPVSNVVGSVDAAAGSLLPAPQPSTSTSTTAPPAVTVATLLPAGGLALPPVTVTVPSLTVPSLSTPVVTTPQITIPGTTVTVDPQNPLTSPTPALPLIPAEPVLAEGPVVAAPATERASGAAASSAVGTSAGAAGAVPATAQGTVARRGARSAKGLPARVPAILAPASAATPVALAEHAAKTFAFPLGLLGLLLAFVVLQGRLDARDPRLAHAPLDGDEELAFR